MIDNILKSSSCLDERRGPQLSFEGFYKKLLTPIYVSYSFLPVQVGIFFYVLKNIHRACRSPVQC